MATCKASKAKKCRPNKMKKKGWGVKNPNRSNKHRVFPARARGFHPLSLQARNAIPGIHKRYQIDRNGTVINLKEEVEQPKRGEQE
ncbi:hypothetical protein LCGC14_0729720 [marine sediment metagenome]|uniref:Uncharacterized protein n=1 Tax=marine sediment metagenome TaxID=412755 RepID=A0A0F9QA60_9ZZZZ